MRLHGDARVSSFLPDSIARLENAVAAAEARGDDTALAASLRELAIARQHRAETPEARELCRQSYDVAKQIGDEQLAAEALNTLGGIDLATGSLDDARRNFLEAVELGGATGVLRARVEQNLGILANIRGDQREALDHYERSLEEYRALSDEHGCAIAYHNLGMVNADRGRLDTASAYYQESFAIARRTGNTYLQALCLVNEGEVEVSRARHDIGRDKAEAALRLFERLGVEGSKASAHRVIGMAHREAGRSTLAESALQTSMEVAVSTGSVPNQAEASRELGLLYEDMGRTYDAQRWLNMADSLFRRLTCRKSA